MPVTVRLPVTLQADGPQTIVVDEPVSTIDELVSILDRLVPGLRSQLDDSVFNFAVNDRMLLHGARTQVLADGDVVEIVPAISGGEQDRQVPGSGPGEVRGSW